MDLEKHFDTFRNHIIGYNQVYHTPYGEKKLRYHDWVASGRLYRPIEDKIANTFGPFVANTHTETSETGKLMTFAYHRAHQLIKDHVHAGPDDVIITPGFGMTAAVNKLQRILGLKGCGLNQRGKCIQKTEKPVVFITHMEHHSNHTSWYETNAEVVVIPPGKDLLVDPEELRKLIQKYKDRPFKIGAFTACSNVTGIEPPYYELATIMHEYNGVCFVDFAASAPYTDIDMHPADPMQKLDAIYFSPHKFLGGPGSSGVLVFDSGLYHNPVPDNPGGGTVDWTNPWGEYKYMDDIELREDGGTPGFLQAFRTALTIEVKNQMNTGKMRKREKELVAKAFEEMRQIPGIKILAEDMESRLGIISFYHEKIHYNLIVRLLSDRFGIQVRGGCACAGTYGHYLLEVSHEDSRKITALINSGDLSLKPGWVRWSLHPTITDEDLYHFTDALRKIVSHASVWEKDYRYDKHTNEFIHHSDNGQMKNLVRKWFNV
ncbi:MAG: aminotransferase class V-fold PLP-dependent enzyme [Chlorobi bacterium]|nr:aminotransferase class V-fold PLP-dependent enzyme [Chlorobiota bacterium]